MPWCNHSHTNRDSLDAQTVSYFLIVLYNMLKKIGWSNYYNNEI